MIRKSSAMKVESREGMRGGKGTVTFRHYFEPGELTANVRLCAELILPPGSSIGRHEHTAEDEVYIVTQGTGLLDDGTQEARITRGDAVLTGRGGTHAVRNDGAEDLRLIAVIACYGPKA